MMLRPQTPMPDFAKFKRTVLTLSGHFYSWLERHSQASVNALDYHATPGEWIGQAQRVHGPPGAAFGAPVQSGIRDNVRRTHQRTKFSADTRPKPDTGKTYGDANPPNPGRPEYGTGEQHGLP